MLQWTCPLPISNRGGQQLWSLRNNLSINPEEHRGGWAEQRAGQHRQKEQRSHDCHVIKRNKEQDDLIGKNKAPMTIVLRKLAYHDHVNLKARLIRLVRRCGWALSVGDNAPWQDCQMLQNILIGLIKCAHIHYDRTSKVQTTCINWTDWISIHLLSKLGLHTPDIRPDANRLCLWT